MKARLITGLLLFLVGISQGEAEPTAGDTLSISGVFAGYTLGDYFHADIIDDHGFIMTAFPPGDESPGLDVFLFLHRWQQVDITLVYREYDLFEAGMQMFPVIIDAASGDEDYSRWYGEACLRWGIETADEFHEVFGDPMEVHELFDEQGYSSSSHLD